MTNVRSTSALTASAAGRSPDAVQRILAAAEKLFAEQGFEAVSMNDIAARADVSKANIFHHFDSKRKLYVAVLRNASQPHAEQQLELLETSDEPLASRFTAFTVGVLRGMLHQERLHRLVQRELLADDDGKLARELADTVYEQKFARLVAFLRAAQRRGELRTDLDPAMAAIALIGANVLFLHSRKVFGHFGDVDFAAEPERYATLLADLLLHGMLSDKTAGKTKARRPKKPAAHKSH